MNNIRNFHEDDSSYPGPERQLILNLQHLEEELQFLEECYPDWFCADYKREIEATKRCINHITFSRSTSSDGYNMDYGHLLRLLEKRNIHFL